MELSLRPLPNATLSAYSGFASAGSSLFPLRGGTSAVPRTGCPSRTARAADTGGGDFRRVALERRRQFWVDEREEDGVESSSYASGDDDEALYLSLSEKPDRSMAVLDDYEMEELDYGSNPDHRSGYVAVLGKPNVGKSTLANQMIGQKLSIVTNKPQTTRHRILGICSGPEYQMILYDTPGVIEKKMHKLDTMMMSNVRSAAVNADCVLVLVDACKVPEKIDEVLEEGIRDLKNKVPTLLVMNKKDLIKPGEIAKKLQVGISYSYGHDRVDLH